MRLYKILLNNEPTNEMLKYKEPDIAQEFLNILTEEEKEEFRIYSIDKLLMKYKMTIIDRTWMYREEHKFNIDYNNGN